MAGLTTPFGQWAGNQPNGQNTLELPQVYSPHQQAQMLQHYLVHGHHPQNSHADQRQYGPMPQTGNPWDASGLPPYPPSLMHSMQKLQDTEHLPPMTRQAIQEFLTRHAGGQ